MLVTIEGVVDSDVCEQGAIHTVEWTPHLRGLVRSGLVTVTDWNPSPPAVSATEPMVEQTHVDKPARRPRSRRRTPEE